jgi:hypothetical protein
MPRPYTNRHREKGAGRPGVRPRMGARLRSCSESAEVPLRSDRSQPSLRASALDGTMTGASAGRPSRNGNSLLPYRSLPQAARAGGRLHELLALVHGVPGPSAIQPVNSRTVLHQAAQQLPTLMQPDMEPTIELNVSLLIRLIFVEERPAPSRPDKTPANWIAVGIAIGLLLGACGSRTGLAVGELKDSAAPENAGTDGPETAGPCDEETCRVGCCQGDLSGGMRRVCVDGLSSEACGVGGLFCSNCGTQRCMPSPDMLGGFCE